GNRVQSKVSWTQRTRRKPRFEKKLAITPGLPSTPASVPPLPQSPSVIVPPVKDGQFLAARVNRSVYAPLASVSSVASAGAESNCGVPPILNASCQKPKICVANAGLDVLVDQGRVRGLL